MNLAAKLSEVARLLRNGGIQSARRDALYLLAHALDLESPSALWTHITQKSAPFPKAADAALTHAIAARIAHQPIAQIIGKRLFWGRYFKVTPDVLDPRPETECLIEQALKHPFSKILDLGTGSGAILLSLLAERPRAQGVGVDICEKALAIAKENAARIGVDAHWQKSDWFSELLQDKFDLVIANPPYISAAEYACLSPEIGQWEPKSALYGGPDGLDAYRAILHSIKRHLQPGGRVLFEIGATQESAVAGLVQKAGLKDCRCFPDLDGRARVMQAYMRE